MSVAKYNVNHPDQASTRLPAGCGRVASEPAKRGRDEGTETRDDEGRRGRRWQGRRQVTSRSAGVAPVGMPEREYEKINAAGNRDGERAAIQGTFQVLHPGRHSRVNARAPPSQAANALPLTLADTSGHLPLAEAGPGQGQQKELVEVDARYRLRLATVTCRAGAAPPPPRRPGPGSSGRSRVRDRSGLSRGS